jgi:choline/glycine/proline betaine transport protein
MFIARVSKGRTIREFILGVMIIPSVVTFFWMTVFGNTAIQFAMTDTAPALVDAVTTDLPTALFVLLEQFPVPSITTLLAMVMVITFFVTSSDSGSLVIDIITAGGHLDPPAVQRVYWAGMEGAVAATLLLAGGIGALQTAALATALPFTVVMILLCYSLHKSLNKDYPRPRRPHVAPGEPSTRRPQQ